MEHGADFFFTDEQVQVLQVIFCKRHFRLKLLSPSGFQWTRYTFIRKPTHITKRLILEFTIDRMHIEVYRILMCL